MNRLIISVTPMARVGRKYRQSKIVIKTAVWSFNIHRSNHRVYVSLKNPLDCLRDQ